MIKRLLFLLLFPALCYAGEISVTNFGGGLNTQDSPAAIDPSQAQDLLNVAAIPGGLGLYKRDGFSFFSDTNGAGVAHGGYHFQQLSGSDVQLWGAGTTLVSFVNDLGAGSVGPTFSNNATWQCTDSQGFAYCFDSANDTPVKTDGTVAGTTQPAGIPVGTMGAMTPTRLLVAGVVGNLNTIYYSQQNNFSNFTTGVLTSDAGTEIIASPGSRITHLAYYFGKWFWWKDSSFGYVTGDDQYSLAITIVSNTVGTIDNSDAFWNAGAYTSEKSGAPSSSAAGSIYGGIYFRGQDNHFYLYDGYSLTRLSRSITPTVLLANRKKANFWTQSSQSDFNTGAYVSSTTYSSSAGGVVWISTNNINIPQNSFEGTLSSWTISGTVGWAQHSGNIVGINCTMSPADGSSNIAFGLSGNPVENTYIMGELDSYPSGVFLSSVAVALASNSCANVTQIIPAAPSAAKSLVTVNFHSYLFPTSKITSAPFLYSGSTITFTTASDTVLSAGGAPVTSIDFVQGGLTNFTGSGIYYSAVHNASSLTSWGNFSATTVGTGGTQTFFVRSSTSTFSKLSSTPTWVAQTNNTTVAASTGTFFQMSDTFTVTAASYTPTLSGFTFNWYEGNAAEKSYITYYDDKIWFAVSQGAAVTTNNRIYVWDLLNRGWFIYDIPCNGFLIENNILYIGNTTNGYVFRYGSVPTDNGAAINSYWRSKAFIGADPYVQNEFNQADFITTASTPTALSYTYTLDTANATTLSIPLGNATNTIVKRGFLLPKGKIGTFYDFKIGDNSGNPKWTVLSHKVVYNPLNWNPQNQ